MIKYLLAIMLFSSAALADIQSSETIQLGTANTVVFRGEVNDDSAQKAALELIRLDIERGSKDYPIYLVLDTPGGSIDSGEMFIELAKGVKNLKTITVFAASMGSAIVEALPGERLILDSGILMFHRAAGQVGGQFETGELESRLEMYKRYVRRMEQRNANRMKMPLSVYKKKVKDELWYTSADAVNELAADRMVSITCTKALMESKQTITVAVFIFALDLEFSGCPLLRAGIPSAGQDEAIVSVYHKLKGNKNVKD